MLKNLVKLGVEIINFKNTIGRTILNFSCKTSVFLLWFYVKKLVAPILRSTGTESVYVTFPYPCTGTEIVRMTGKVEKRVDGY